MCAIQKLSIHKLLHCLRNFIPHCTWHVGYNPQLGMLGYIPTPASHWPLEKLDDEAFHKSWHDHRDFENNWCVIKNKIAHISKRCHLYLEMPLSVTLLHLKVKKHMLLLQTYPFVTAILAISRCMAMIFSSQYDYIIHKGDWKVINYRFYTTEREAREMDRQF